MTGASQARELAAGPRLVSVARPVHVYRLEIAYPQGSHEPGWTPALWSRLPRRTRRKLERAGFRWPAERMFLSASAAYRRAWRLRCYGAEAEVCRSAPVTWPEAPPARWERAFDAMAAGPHAEEWPEFDLCGIPKRVPGQG
jgi:hypothetical protein